MRSERVCEGYAPRVVFKDPLPKKPQRKIGTQSAKSEESLEDFVLSEYPGSEANRENSQDRHEGDEEERVLADLEARGEEQQEKSVVDELMALWIVSEPSAVVHGHHVRNTDGSHTEKVPFES